MTPYSAIGQPTPLIDGRAKVTGAIRYAPGLRVPGMLYARFVTSTHAHARLRGVHVEAALSVPGVARVLTANNLPDIAPTSRTRLLLARDRVLFVGHPVAIVLAESEAAADDGAEQVQVDYEPLPAAVTMDEALMEDAPLVWPGGKPGQNDEISHGPDLGRKSQMPGNHGNICSQMSYKRGDIERGLAEADIIIERTINAPMVHHNYMEPQAMLVQPEVMTGGVTIWSTTQGPFYQRREVAEVLGVRETDVRIIATPLGGGFGGKFVLYEPLMALAARTVGRPIRLVLTRMEELLTTMPTPAIRVVATLGAKHDGTLVALDADVIEDAGCFSHGLSGITAMLLGSMYRIPNFDLRTTEIFTFKPSTTAYRAPGAPQATFALEVMIDELSRRTHIDALELRLQNAAHPGDLMATGKVWANMGMTEVLLALRDHPAWQERDKTRSKGRGVGIAIGTGGGAIEPATASCMLQRDGTLHVYLGSVDVTGSATAFTLIAAEAFGVSPEQVRVVLGDTSNAPYSSASVGSQTIYTVGPAVIEAAREARAQVLEIAAEEFEADPADLEIVDGSVRVRGVPHRALSLTDIACKTMGFEARYRPVYGRGRSAQTLSSMGFCAQLAEVEVDRETGAIHVHRLVLVQDVGLAINPLAVHGQMMGGATQGVGWALLEQMVHDENGQLLTGSWMDYAIPDAIQTASNIETVIVEVPSEDGPFGARGVGEPPVVATAAAIANAVGDATGIYPAELPMTAPRVFDALSAEDNRQ
jgi:CO/xanthine dehydrogenase Mo-binding subunit